MTPKLDLVIPRMMQILAEHHPDIERHVSEKNFLQLSDEAARRVLDWTKKRKEETPWLKDWAVGLRALRDNYTEEIRGDPFLGYIPAHGVALAFHKSPAKVKLNQSGNGTSKTHTAYAEHVAVSTGRNRWRQCAPPPTSAFIVGVDFGKYATGVFAAKFVNGEPHGPYGESMPWFPEHGRWLNHFDDRKHIIRLACPECAAKWTPKDCRHSHSIIQLFSDNEGAGVLQGSSRNVGHLDEEVDEAFFDEGLERLARVPFSWMMITATPLLGIGRWEQQRLVSLFNKGPTANVWDASTNQPYVSYHTISQYDAGLYKRETIDGKRATMDPLEVEARVFGRAMPLSRNFVFDRFVLAELRRKVTEPIVGHLEMEETDAAISFAQHEDGDLRVWAMPEAGRTYAIGADTASGLTNRDYSCATVVLLPDMRVVAQLHGWINPIDYANSLYRLGKWYNAAMIVPERNSYGLSMIQRLLDLSYPNMFIDMNSPAAVENQPINMVGIDTNIRTKPMMVGALQKFVRERQIQIPDGDTIDEMLAFGQEKTESGLNTRLRAERGMNDDRVISLALVCYVAITYPTSMVPVRQSNEASSEFWSNVHDRIRGGDEADYV